MNTATSLLGLLFDHTIGNILRMLAVIRLPKLERGPVSHGFVATLIVIVVALKTKSLVWCIIAGVGSYGLLILI